MFAKKKSEVVKIETVSGSKEEKSEVVKQPELSAEELAFKARMEGFYKLMEEYDGAYSLQSFGSLRDAEEMTLLLAIFVELRRLREAVDLANKS